MPAVFSNGRSNHCRTICRRFGFSVEFPSVNCNLLFLRGCPQPIGLTTHDTTKPNDTQHRRPTLAKNARMGRTLCGNGVQNIAKGGPPPASRSGTVFSWSKIFQNKAGQQTPPRERPTTNDRRYVPSDHPARYSSCSGVSRSILIPIDSSFSLATLLSSSSGTRYTRFSSVL